MIWTDQARSVIQGLPAEVVSKIRDGETGAKHDVPLLFLDRIVTQSPLPLTRNRAVKKLQQSKSLRSYDLEAKCFRFTVGDQERIARGRWSDYENRAVFVGRSAVYWRVGGQQPTRRHPIGLSEKSSGAWRRYVHE